MSSETVLTVDNVGVTFNDHVILRGISFSAHRGDLIALVGPNGSGKSVLLRTLLGIIPHTGTVSWGQSLRIGYVPQTISIERDLPFNGYEFFSVKHISRNRTRELASAVGIEPDVLSQPMGQLSAGQLQRLMIAWALSNDPDVLLFDEPTSGIDVAGQESVYDLLDRMRRERRLTILLVSHDLNVVFSRADHVLCISRDLVCHGPPKLALDTATLEKLYGPSVGLYTHLDHHEH